MRKEGPQSWSEPKGFVTDLGSLAKGYAQDRAAAILRAQGFKNFLINAGGQVYAAGRKPGGGKWRVGILNPRQQGSLLGSMELEDQGMSTSGDYEQATLIHGKRYHHILDPSTGWPSQSGVASSTVIINFKDYPYPGGWADSLDTAALVLGPVKGKALLESQGVGGVLVLDQNGKLSAVLTKDLAGKLKLNF